MRNISIKPTSLTIFACLSFFSINIHAASYAEIDKNDSATVYWSPPAFSFSSTSYKLYFRLYDSPDTSWKYLGSTVDTTFILKKEATGSGSFVLAVTACEDNVESDKHTSLDSTAIPRSGWYLSWVGSTLVIKEMQPTQKIERPQAFTFLLDGKKTSSKNISTGMKLQKYPGFIKKEVTVK